MNDFLKDEEVKNNNQSEVTSKLLMEMVINQKQNIKNLIKIFLVTIICFTILLISMITGFFIYESQFETIDSQYMIEQNAESDNSGNAIVNNGGDVHYGESNSDN